MAPEVALGKGYSFGIDYWSIAVTLFEMLTGHHPWRAKKSFEVLAQQLDKGLVIHKRDRRYIDPKTEHFIRSVRNAPFFSIW